MEDTYVIRSVKGEALRFEVSKESVIITNNGMTDRDHVLVCDHKDIEDLIDWLREKIKNE